MVNRLIVVLESILGALILLIVFQLSMHYYGLKTPKKQTLIQIPDLVEAEDLKFSNKSPNLNCQNQDTSTFEGAWSKNSHLFCTSQKPREWVEFEIPSLYKGKFDLSVYLTKSYDYGIVRFLVNGKKIGQDIDLYSGGLVLATDKISLGSASMKKDSNLLRIEIVGKNEDNTTSNYHFGIDGVLFEKPQK